MLTISRYLRLLKYLAKSGGSRNLGQYNWSKKSRDLANKPSYLPENKYHIIPYRTQQMFFNFNLIKKKQTKPNIKENQTFTRYLLFKG